MLLRFATIALISGFVAAAAADNHVPPSDLEDELAVIDRIAAYTTTLAQRPDDIDALNALGEIYLKVGADDRATPLFQRALALDPGLVSVRLNLAHLFSRDGLTVEAEDVLRKGLARAPEDLSLRLALAESQLAVRYPAGAQATIEAGLPWHKNDPRLRLMLGQIRIMNRETDTAITDLETASRLPVIDAGEINSAATNEIKARASFTLALVAQRQTDNSALARYLDACLIADPSHRGALLMAAELAVVQEQLPQAISYLVSLLALPMDQRPSENEVLRTLPYPAGLQVWAQALARSDQRDEAIELLSRSAHAARDRGRSDWAKAFEDWSEAL